ncbi:unnamed protein product, partial [Mesorhabditis belari]|uniref:Uncharacterized protein n=1 Tax=Mesorhabditis belari TaxID=2138241 RepID=A0AAF3EED0_9BILA
MSTAIFARSSPTQDSDGVPIFQFLEAESSDAENFIQFRVMDREPGCCFKTTTIVRNFWNETNQLFTCAFLMAFWICVALLMMAIWLFFERTNQMADE